MSFGWFHRIFFLMSFDNFRHHLASALHCSQIHGLQMTRKLWGKKQQWWEYCEKKTSNWFLLIFIVSPNRQETIQIQHSAPCGNTFSICSIDLIEKMNERLINLELKQKAIESAEWEENQRVRATVDAQQKVIDYLQNRGNFKYHHWLVTRVYICKSRWQSSFQTNVIIPLMSTNRSLTLLLMLQK